MTKKEEAITRLLVLDSYMLGDTKHSELVDIILAEWEKEYKKIPLKKLLKEIKSAEGE